MSYRIASLLVLVAGLFLHQPAFSGTPIDRIIAVVDDEVVLESELDQELETLTKRLQQNQQQPGPDTVLRKQALERLIRVKLQLAAAERSGIEVDAQTLNATIKNIAKRNRLTIPELRAALARDGIGFEQFQHQLRNDIIISRLRNREVLNRIQVSDAEIDAQLMKANAQASSRRELHLLHLLIPVPEDASAEQKTAAMGKAEQLMQRLRDGEDFRQLAQQESAGRQADKGGDLGWIKADQVPTLFASAVETLKKGDLAGPLTSASGLHIIKLEDYRGGDRQLIPQTHVRHILIKTNELTSDSDARERLSKIRERLANGEDFATLARSHSDDAGSAINGGDLGWANPGDMVPAFENTMNSLAIGELSQPFRTQFGWHIVQVLERRQHDATDEVRRRQAREAIRNRKAQVAGEQYLRRLRDEAYVEIRLEDS